MKYKILTLQDTPTSTGKSKKTVSISDEGGTTLDKVGIWSDFPNYANLAVGQTVEAEVKLSPDGKWRNLVPPATGTKPYAVRGASQGMITKAMESKKESIEHFTDKKELGIKISSTMRMAVDCAIADMASLMNKPDATSILEKSILKWRKWLWENWEAKDTDFAPFPSKPDERVREEDRHITPDIITFEARNDAEEEYNQM